MILPLNTVYLYSKMMDLGDETPENLYRAIAEVIAFVYIFAGKFPKSYTPTLQISHIE